MTRGVSTSFDGRDALAAAGFAAEFALARGQQLRVQVTPLGRARRSAHRKAARWISRAAERAAFRKCCAVGAPACDELAMALDLLLTPLECRSRDGRRQRDGSSPDYGNAFVASEEKALSTPTASTAVTAK
jgi:hypothetical protein